MIMLLMLKDIKTCNDNDSGLLWQIIRTGVLSSYDANDYNANDTNDENDDDTHVDIDNDLGLLW